MYVHATSKDQIPSGDLGEVRHLHDGRYLVHFERHLRHPIDVVWTALTDPEQLAHWWPGLTLELRTGGAFEIRFGGDCDGGSDLMTGTVVAFDPPRVLQLGTIRFELEAVDGGTVLRFSDELDSDDPRSLAVLAESVLGGWHWHLDRLVEVLDGKAANFSEAEPRYDVSLSG